MPLNQLPSSFPHMEQSPRIGVPGMVQQPTTNLLSLLVDTAFGFIAGLMVFFGPMPVIAYGTHLAMDLMKQTGYGSGPLAMYGFTAAPYVILLPIGGFALKELASVRSIKGFFYFAAAILIGFALAFFTRGSFAQLLQ
jgi:hypothetical protein